MGAILNRFDELMDLKNSECRMEKYKLTAVIVHNCHDKSLCKCIRDYFVNFAEMTGENFMFLTFIQPTPSLREKLKQNKYAFAKYWGDGVNINNQNEKQIVTLLRDYFVIKDDNKSYMVLAKNLSDTNLELIPITEKSLPYQFFDLRNYCDNPEDFEGLVRKLKAKPFEIKDPLIDSLLKISSLIIPKPEGEDHSGYSKEQKECARKTIIEEKLKLLDYVKDSNEEQTDKILQLYNLIEGVYLNVFNTRQQKELQTKCNYYDKLCKESKSFWDTYSRLSSLMEETECDNLDYSAFVLYMGKIIEKEFNLTICQMLREIKGIEMPRFYDKYCESCNECPIDTTFNQQNPNTKRHSVKINEKQISNGAPKLKSVTLGDLYYAYTTICAKSNCCYSASKMITMSKEYLDSWKNLFNARNNAAHTGTSSYEQYQKARRSFENLLSDESQQIFKLKEHLSPKRYKSYSSHWKK